MSSERDPKTNPSTAERVGGSVKKPEQPRGDEPDFKTLFHAWLESHRASLVDSVGRLIKQPIGSFFTCLVMAGRGVEPAHGPGAAAGQRRTARWLVAACRADIAVHAA